jgi:hypothetical protein
VKKCRDGLNGDMHMKTRHTVGEEGADVATLMNRELRLGQLEVSASPALLERCK